MVLVHRQAVVTPLWCDVQVGLERGGPGQVQATGGNEDQQYQEQAEAI